VAIEARLLVLAVLLCLAGCNASSVKVKQQVVPDPVNCRPDSAISKERATSQAACHVGVAGDGAQVLVSDTHRRLSFHSDTTQRQLTSIFIQPESALHEAGPLEFTAFHSSGAYDLYGKTGCVGVLENGSATIVKSKRRSRLTYELEFRLVSPVGWKHDCTEPYRMAGSFDL